MEEFVFLWNLKKSQIYLNKIVFHIVNYKKKEKKKKRNWILNQDNEEINAKDDCY